MAKTNADRGPRPPKDWMHALYESRRTGLLEGGAGERDRLLSYLQRRAATHDEIPGHSGAAVALRAVAREIGEGAHRAPAVARLAAPPPLHPNRNT